MFQTEELLDQVRRDGKVFLVKAMSSERAQLLGIPAADVPGQYSLTQLLYFDANIVHAIRTVSRRSRCSSSPESSEAVQQAMMLYSMVIGMSDVWKIWVMRSVVCASYAFYLKWSFVPPPPSIEMVVGASLEANVQYQ